MPASARAILDLQDVWTLKTAGRQDRDSCPSGRRGWAKHQRCAVGSVSDVTRHWAIEAVASGKIDT